MAFTENGDVLVVTGLREIVYRITTLIGTSVSRIQGMPRGQALDHQPR